MPTNSIDYHMQDARNNFDAMRPAPVCTDANQSAGQCQIHISTNCYYGYHEQPKIDNQQSAGDCEMMDASSNTDAASSASPQSNARKRSADDDNTPMTKRFREEVQREKSIEPETKETFLDTSSEDILESLLWNIHGGTVFHLIQCL